MLSESTLTNPTDLMQELGIKKDVYYLDLQFLGIKAMKGDDRKAYLTQEQADRVRALRSHMNQTGTRVGFDDGKPVNGLAIKEKNELATTQDIYTKPEDPIADQDMGQVLFRKGAELKARETAMPDLVVRAIADQLTEEQLPEDLQQKVELCREAANPKYTPADLASQLISRYAVGG
jgi:hypothetical protein